MAPAADLSQFEALSRATNMEPKFSMGPDGLEGKDQFPINFGQFPANFSVD